MPRPRLRRKISFEPNTTYFKPAGIRVVDLKETILTLEEFEAIRLIDLKDTQQIKAAKQMNISQPTLSRLLISARKKLADAIINGKAIKIKGGDYKMVQPRKGLRRGTPKGRMGGAAQGPGGNCVCPKCGKTYPHKVSVPCFKRKCDKCGEKLTRE